MNPRCKTTLCVLILVIFGAINLNGEKNASKGSGSSQSSSGGSDTTSGQSGITGGGGFAIESEVFAYRALLANSEEIADEIVNVLAKQPNHTPGKVDAGGNTVAIITDEDLKNYMSMRSFVAQSHILQKRLDTLLSSVKAVKAPDYSPVSQGPATPERHGAAKPTFDIFSSISDLPSTAQTSVGVLKDILGLFAINRSVTGVKGDIKDDPLINMVGTELVVRKVKVLIPGAYTPSLFASNDLGNTILQDEVDKLENTRSGLSDELYRLNPEVEKARAILASDRQSEENKAAARVFLSNIAVIGLRESISAIDAFVSSLFGGANEKPSKSQDSDTERTKDGAKKTNQSSSTEDSSKAQPNPASPSNFAAVLAGASIQKALWETNIPDSASKSVHLLKLQSLESGGGMLTKSSLLAGQHVLFSGGAVSTFSLFKANGELECSGNVWGYEDYVEIGHILEKAQAQGLDLNKQLLGIRSDCRNQTVKDQ